MAGVKVDGVLEAFRVPRPRRHPRRRRGDDDRRARSRATAAGRVRVAPPIRASDAKVRRWRRRRHRQLTPWKRRADRDRRAAASSWCKPSSPAIPSSSSSTAARRARCSTRHGSASSASPATARSRSGPAAADCDRPSYVQPRHARAPRRGDPRPDRRGDRLHPARATVRPPHRRRARLRLPVAVRRRARLPARAHPPSRPGAVSPRRRGRHGDHARRLRRRESTRRSRCPAPAAPCQAPAATIVGRFTIDTGCCLRARADDAVRRREPPARRRASRRGPTGFAARGNLTDTVSGDDHPRCSSIGGVTIDAPDG